MTVDIATSGAIGDWTLAMEGSSASGSVALFRAGTLSSFRAVPMGASRDDALFPAVVELFAESGVSPRVLSHIVCGAGPGSFTSLRIAAAVAKGLAHATGASLWAVPSLLLAAASHDTPGRYLVHADALRGERYALAVSIDDEGRVHADADVARVEASDLLTLASGRTLLCVPSAAPCLLGEPVVPNAAHLPRIAEWRTVGPVSLQHWEPAYGRLAEAQVKWETTHQRPLSATE